MAAAEVLQDRSQLLEAVQTSDGAGIELDEPFMLAVVVGTARRTKKGGVQ
jgi:hypothetical protein